MAEAVQNLASNIGCTVLSLYSGLGGAELSMDMLYQQVLAKTQRQEASSGTDTVHPTKPVFAAACDIDPVCQKVLGGHKSPPEHIVVDIMDFIQADVRLQLLGNSFGLYSFGFRFPLPSNCQTLREESVVTVLQFYVVP